MVQGLLEAYYKYEHEKMNKSQIWGTVGLASEHKIKSYSTLKIPRSLVLYRSVESSTAGSFNYYLKKLEE